MQRRADRKASEIHEPIKERKKKHEFDYMKSKTAVENTKAMTMVSDGPILVTQGGEERVETRRQEETQEANGARTYC